jgi:hypothetical protein
MSSSAAIVLVAEPVCNAIREAHAARVPIYVCDSALASAGIEDVMPETQRVPQAAAKILCRRLGLRIGCAGSDVDSHPFEPVRGRDGGQ